MTPFSVGNEIAWAADRTLAKNRDIRWGESVMRFAKLALACALGLSATALMQPAHAQFSSTQPVTLVVGFAAGGAADIVGRLIAEQLGAHLDGAKVVVENRGGASGNTAARLVASSPPNGHTILVTTTAIAVNETLSKDKGFSSSDLRTISIAAATPDVLVVHPSNPAKTLQEFVANAKKKSITFGTAGVSTSPYVAAAYFFKELAKVEAVHVPFPGGAPALNALLGGHIDAVAITLPTPVPHIKDARLRGLAVASKERMAVVPNVPTYEESGYPGFLHDTWIGLFVNSKTSNELAEKLNGAVNAVLNDTQFQKRLNDIGFRTQPRSLADADSYYRSEIQGWNQMITRIGLTADK
jgi:tripartite-type tricarboxylate transporter receptor subunit TctC